MIDKYFLKLLLSIWFCLIIILIFISFTLRQIDTPLWVTAQQNLLLNTYAESAQATFDLHGVDGLRSWINDLSKRAETHMFILDEKNKTILSINKAEKININNLIDSALEDAKAHKFNNYIIGPYIINTPDQALRLVAQKKGLNAKQVHYIPNVWVRVIVALIIAFLFCYLIIAGIYMKLRRIRKTVNIISKGHFIDKIELHSNSSEVSMLLKDVAFMSQNIANLIAAKNRLIQDISHEFRSPLARQLMAIEIAKQQLHGGQLNYFDRIQEENTNLEGLVSELLEYSKVNKETELIVETINMRDLLSKVIANVKFEYQTDCISLCCPKELYFNGDIGLLYRAFENLLRNAAQYAGIKKEISIVASYEDRALTIKFNDKGPGVNKNERYLMFQPFYRIDKNHKKKGHGLGLSIAQQIIELHNGNIYADNREGGGLCITVILP